MDPRTGFQRTSGGRTRERAQALVQPFRMFMARGARPVVITDGTTPTRSPPWGEPRGCVRRALLSTHAGLGWRTGGIVDRGSSGVALSDGI